ncbi:pilus assembly protein PilP [Pseudomonas gingeri NCPPB 3146 = LMG 5327]|uniref:Pilus assembly protein PilP n=2 Tax=Pseudomonas gingeri TaxID=117681 RepID=A0A7Y7Y0C9_9PSED|nr:MULTISPECIES: pilus assembly protein PilP [Pseudomonas]NVZ25152.1 pilus assembly protein PilP [Pseudomonas gingeri]NWA06679.1 pilus assembly protein PilP [Pseudomonas gingeri]NWC15639.1 pilus assembly protein PilP [Pseudomonas gingeri]NWE48267.1 pilus assembly protein PilP [Pseudomonas gingeri]NWE69214.1 pilus assembly protein PilP [Pseudomonas gingeri]
MSGLRGLCVAMVAVLLAGCGNSNDFSDLDAYMREVRARPAGNIEPTPKFISYEAFTYNASSLRSPFQPPVKIDLVNRQKGSHEVKPDPNRTKQFLEGFNIEQFEMVGTLSNASGTYALLRGAGGVHRLKVGDYLGRNEGRIVAITDSQVEVIEIVPDGEGTWLERPRTIPLKEHS